MYNMYCFNCYAPISETAKFCSNCGAPQLQYRVTYEEWLASTLPGSFRDTVIALIRIYNEVRTSNYVLAVNNSSCLQKTLTARQENSKLLGLEGTLGDLEPWSMVSACSDDLQVLIFGICYAEYDDFRSFIDLQKEFESPLRVIQELMNLYIKKLSIDSLGPVWARQARFGFGAPKEKPEVYGVRKFIDWFNVNKIADGLI